jgi:hypothetical protein
MQRTTTFLVSAATGLIAAGLAATLVARGPEGSTTSRAARAQVQDERCPQAKTVERPRPEVVVRALRAQLPQLFDHIDRRRYRIDVVFSLSRSTRVPGVNRSRYKDIALRACGGTVAERSWAASLHFPFAPAASFGPAIAYLAPTASGWRLWHGWLPNLGTRPFFPGD